jgi:type I restriction enzyme S subunit
MENYKQTELGLIPEDWEVKEVKKIAKIYDGTHSTPNYVDYGIPFYSVEHITSNNFKNTKFISEEVFFNENKRVKLERGDILMSRIGDIGTAKYIDWDVNASFYVTLALFKKITEKIDFKFITFSINSSVFAKELHKRTLHVAFPKKINLGDIGKCKIPLPPLPEQKKIADCLSTWDVAIEKQSALINALTQRKKALMQQLLTGKKRLPGFEGKWKEVKLGSLCKVTTGKLDANAMVENGIYRFYTCAKDYYLINEYKFDTEALLISGNGANVGYIHYYKGKFNAYQRTYVLDKFKEDIFFIKYFLDYFLSQRISNEKKEGNTPYIVLSTLTEMSIKLPSLSEQTAIAEILTIADRELQLQKEKLAQLQTQKN